MSRRSPLVLIAALVTVLAGSTLPQTPAVAASTVRLTGTVYDTAGQPLSDVHVELYRNGVDDGTRVATRRTATSGRFTFPAVARSAKTTYYLIAADRSGHHVLTYTESFPATSRTTPDVMMPVAGTITGKVSTKDGDAVEPGTTIQVSADGPDVRADALVAANGTFRLGGLASGSYRLYLNDLSEEFSSTCYDNVRFGADGCDGAMVEVAAGKVTTIAPQVLDHREGVLSGTVTDAAGKPLSDITIGVYAADDESSFIAEASTSASGSWTRNGIEFAGRVKLVARDDSGAHRTTWYRDATTFDAATPLRLKDSGEIDDITFVLPAS